MRKNRKQSIRKKNSILLPDSSSLQIDEKGVSESGSEQEWQQRDLEPDEFDFGTDVNDERVRGAGGQSLAELMIVKEQGWGLEEHGGGLRHDRPEPNANDFDPSEPTELEPVQKIEKKQKTKRRSNNEHRASS